MLIIDAVSPLERIQLSGALAVAVKALSGVVSALERVKLAREVADILVKLGEAAGIPSVPATDDELSDDPNSPNYRYRDTGYIADSRKEKAADQIRVAKQNGEQVMVTSIDWKAIEQNPRQAKDLIVKSNLFGQVDWDALQARGMDPAAGFLIDRVYASIAPSPDDNPEARQDYARALQTIRARLESLTTVKEVRDVLGQIKDEMTGANLNEEETERYAEVRAKINALSIQIKDNEGKTDELYRLAQIADSEKYQAERVVDNRKKRGWAEDPATTAKFVEASAIRDRAWDVWGKAVTARKAVIAPLEAERSDWYEQSKAIMTEALERNAGSPLTRGWLSFGSKFLAVIKYRYNTGSSSFRGHITNAENGRIPDWSWANRERTKPIREATKSEVSFQLKVADSYQREGGKDVSVTSTLALKDAYGLREVQSGNWVLKDPNSAKFHVEQTAAAMSDLGDMLGIDAAHLGLGGRLAMAFGARGTGGKNAALAHFEPVLRVINLTKLGGGGSLGHELFHAFDNILPSLVNETAGAKDEFGTNKPDLFPAGPLRDAFASLRSAILVGDKRSTEVFTITAKDRALAVSNIGTARQTTIAQKISAAGNATDAVLAVDAVFAGRTDKKSLKNKKGWRQIAAAFYAPEGEDFLNIPTGRPMSNFASAAVDLDAGGDGKYWSQDIELAARAFQSWLEDRMASQDRRNDYLSAMADNKHYDADTKPYPEGEERARINAAFDAVFGAIRDAKVFENASSNKALLDSIFGEEPTLDGIGDGPVVAHADPSVLPMDQDTRTILKAAQKFALAKFGNKRVINTSDGSEILIDNNGIMHGLSAGAGINDALVSTDLENLLRNATFMRKEDDRKGRPDILAVYRYGAMVEVQGKPLAIGVVVREHRDGRRYYDHFELKSRKVA